ncbi:MAG: hypothetical protein KDD51_03345 [Bdellovibrionales bacterium]|nr:hypothetical protein [Bdellovibrionales bacterium]
MTRFLIICLCLLASVVLAEEADFCRDATSAEALWFRHRALPVTPPAYERRSARDPRFFVRADVDFTGALSLVFLTKIVAPDGTVQRSELRAEEEFTRILEHFDGTYNRLRLVYAAPEPDEEFPLGDMIAEVNHQTAAGVSLRSALSGTFFVRQAYRHGFSSLYIDNVDGADGHYELVVFELKR